MSEISCLLLTIDKKSDKASLKPTTVIKMLKLFDVPREIQYCSEKEQSWWRRMVAGKMYTLPWVK